MAFYIEGAVEPLGRAPQPARKTPTRELYHQSDAAFYSELEEAQKEYVLARGKEADAERAVRNRGGREAQADDGQKSEKGSQAHIFAKHPRLPPSFSKEHIERNRQKRSGYQESREAFTIEKKEQEFIDKEIGRECRKACQPEIDEYVDCTENKKLWWWNVTTHCFDKCQVMRRCLMLMEGKQGWEGGKVGAGASARASLQEAPASGARKDWVKCPETGEMLRTRVQAGASAASAATTPAPAKSGEESWFAMATSSTGDASTGVTSGAETQAAETALTPALVNPHTGQPWRRSAWVRQKRADLGSERIRSGTSLLRGKERERYNKSVDAVEQERRFTDPDWCDW